jgi:hypothetical protein
MGAGDGGADALGVADDRVALAAKFLHQAAYAHLIVGVAALERVDFGMDQRLEFRCAGNGALDAFVHGRDFAANGLADGEDAVAGNVFRLGEAQGDLGHRAGGGTHLAGACHHDREGEEDEDRNDDRDQEADGRRHCQQIGDGADLPDRRGVKQVCQSEHANCPQQREQGGVADRAAARTAFERAQQTGGVLAAVVVGRRHRACRREWRGRGLGRSVFARRSLCRLRGRTLRGSSTLEFAGRAGDLVFQLIQGNVVEMHPGRRRSDRSSAHLQALRTSARRCSCPLVSYSCHSSLITPRRGLRLPRHCSRPRCGTTRSVRARGVMPENSFPAS